MALPKKIKRALGWARLTFRWARRQAGGSSGAQKFWALHDAALRGLARILRGQPRKIRKVALRRLPDGIRQAVPLWPGPGHIWDGETR